MTTIEDNTFTGPNSGVAGGYVPLTTIESTSMDGDLGLVKDDLDYHLGVLQAIYAKLDTVELNATAVATAVDMVSAINVSAELIDADNLESTVALLSNIVTDIESHRITTTQGDMHTENSIKSTGQTYSYTPGAIVTSCQNVLDEINNLRRQIHNVVGKTTWIDTPDTTLAAIKSKLDTIESGATGDQTASEIRVLVDAATDSNVFTDADNSKLDGIENNANYYIADGSLNLSLVIKTANYIAQLSDYTILCNAASAPITITLPSASGNSGRVYNVKKIDSSVNAITIDGYGIDLIDNASTVSITVQNNSYTVQCDGTNWYIV